MSDRAAVAISSTRVRALSFASSALLVTLICLVLLALSRVVTRLEHEPVVGVQVEIVPRHAPARAAPRQRTPPQQRTTDADTEPIPTPVPFSHEMLARTLRCFDLRPGEQRPAECPPMPPSQFARSGGVFPSEPQRDPRDLMTNADRNLEAFMDTGPCQGVCIPIGRDPPPPSRSPMQICAEGGVGPCGTPIFRADEVVRLPHTQ